MFIIEVKEKKDVQVGTKIFDGIPMFNRERERQETPIMEEKVTLILRQEVEKIDLKELVKLLNGIV